MTWLLGVLALIASWLPVPGVFDIEYRFYERGPQVVALQEELGGIQVDGNDSQVWMDALLAQGLDAIQMTIYARQQAWNSPDLIFHENGDGLIANIRMAKDAGLGVTLVLRVALEQGDISNRHHWHGTIWPEDEDISKWFHNYGEFVLWAADIASSENVDLLVIGSELNSLTSTLTLEKLPEKAFK